MNTNTTYRFVTMLVASVALCALRAVAEDNTSVYYTNGLLNGVGGNVTVGTSGTNNYLEVSNATTLTNAGDAIVSLNGTAMNNLAVLSGPGSTWNVGASTIVGFFGTDAQLVITNGGVMNSAFYGIIGYYYDYVSNNQVKVTGTGSRWNIGPTYGLWVGGNGHNNRLIVENGGVVSNASSTSIGVGTLASSNNLLRVSGTNSLFSNGGDFIWSGAGDNKVIVEDGGRIVSPNYRFYGTPNNQFIITNGGYAQSIQINMGETAAATGNRIHVTGSGSVLSNTGAFYMGLVGAQNHITVDDGGTLYNPGGDFLFGFASPSNTLTVASGGLFNSANLRFFTGANNTTLVTNGGRIQTLSISMGEGVGATDNRLIVTGTGSTLSNTFVGAYTFRVGQTGSRQQLRVEDGGRVDSNGSMPIGGFFGTTTHSNTVAVTGTGSVLNQNADFLLGWGGAANTPSVGNQLLITEGGQMNVVGTFYHGVGDYGATSNLVLVSGSNSLLTVTGGDFMPIRYGVGNRMIVTNGGKVYSINGRPGNSGHHGTVTVTGNGSVWSNTFGLALGENGHSNTLTVTEGGLIRATSATAGFSTTANRMRVLNGGVLEANILTVGVGAGNSISNIGGIYQFTAAPTTTPNGFGRIAITDGTISYRDFATANIADANVGNIAFAGNNTFRLLNSSNTAVATYNFDSVANTGNPANYQRLALVGGGSRWQGTTLNIGSGGALLVSNAENAVVAAVLNSTGSIAVVNSKVTYNSAVAIHGSYISDPSTNTFLADLTVGVSGTLAGGVGDLFDFKKNLFIHATNNIGFKLGKSAVTFSGGGMHTNAITGDDLGGGKSAFDTALDYDMNFAYGELHIGSAADSICFECGDIPLAPSNALYVGWLDLLSSASLVTNLHAPSNINIYYLVTDTRNAYLNGQTYQLTDCNGEQGGFLMAVIPEPTTTILVALAFASLVRSRAGRNR